jgi:hypothetical protein
MMKLDSVRVAGLWLSGAIAAGGLGFAVGVNEQVGFVATGVAIGLIALGAPATYWVAAALLASLTFRGLVTAGVLPSAATFADIGLAWGALAAALLRSVRPSRPLPSVSQLRWLALLAAASFLSAFFAATEPTRPILYVALLGQPFAIVAALILDPPSPTQRRTLVRLAVGLVVTQIPLALWQAATLGLGDAVQGTLAGAGAGAHTMSAVALVGAVWIAVSRHVRLGRRLALVAILLLIPFLADAKQVLLALPAIAVVGSWRRPKDVLLRAGAVVTALVLLFVVYPSGDTAASFLERAAAGRAGKAEVARLVWANAREDPVTLVVGNGPATTVSRAAFMTTDLLLRTHSPLHVFGLAPAQFAIHAEHAAADVSYGGTSFNSGQSSALGLFGDLGLVGTVAYVGLLLSLIPQLRRNRSPEAIAAAAGFAMFAVLGFVFDWWEQPPFSVFLATLAGLALATKPSASATTSIGQR